MRNNKPNADTVCVECHKHIDCDEEYLWTRKRGWPPTFIHKKCYDKLLPKNGERK